MYIYAILIFQNERSFFVIKTGMFVRFQNDLVYVSNIKDGMATIFTMDLEYYSSLKQIVPVKSLKIA